MENENLIPGLSALITILIDLFDTEEECENPYNKDLEKILLYLCKRSVKNTIPRLHGFVEEVIPTYNQEQFKSHFRIKPSTFNYVLKLIRRSLLRHKAGHKMIPPKKQLLIALWKFGTPGSYRSICEKFNVSNASALKAVRRVTKAIVKLAPRFIKWPEDHEAQEIILGFAATSGFPGVIGVIDSAHINIKAPHINPESYINRKKQHSIHLQAVCDHKGRFTHCVAGHGGSVHDQRVFRLSEVHSYLEDPQKFPNNSHILGDAAYTIHEHVLTPYCDNKHLTDRQKNYNFCHSSTRMPIERAFSLLKGRFRSLLTLLDMERIDLIPDYIIACCVLHNICLLQNDEFPIAEPELEELDNEQFINQRRGNGAGCVKRNEICDNLIMRNV